ncbi:hypothetical protein L7F22_012175 [Adiantum nelumboides]|nr:hypothetical protein [Adiantum nelumboides]
MRSRRQQTLALLTNTSIQDLSNNQVLRSAALLPYNGTSLLAKVIGLSLHLQLVYVAGKKNVVADALFRRPHVAAVSIAYQHELDEMRDHYFIDEDFVEPYDALVCGEHPDLFSFKDGFLMVLVSVLTASLVGQALKPITAAAQGKEFNWKLLIASGGMPSSHSACVTAACTSIALERGLADSLFGLSVVFAGIVLYDAQGVRRAVGKQAEVINTIVVGSDPKPGTKSKQSFAINRQAGLQSVEVSMVPGSSSKQRRSSVMAPMSDEQLSSDSSTLNDLLSKGLSYQRSQNFIETAKKLPSVEAGDVNLQEIGDLDGWRHIPLKESVGHTKLEVLVGALWGIICTLALSHFLPTLP